MPLKPFCLLFAGHLSTDFIELRNGLGGKEHQAPHPVLATNWCATLYMATLPTFKAVISATIHSECMGTSPSIINTVLVIHSYR